MTLRVEWKAGPDENLNVSTRPLQFSSDFDIDDGFWDNGSKCARECPAQGDHLPLAGGRLNKFERPGLELFGAPSELQQRGLFWYPRLGLETSLFPLLTCGKRDVSQPNQEYQNRPVRI
ncbi:hypothetical protein AVEN_186650-1 [Araneus ventricosus]|uniref:Uncharacterized protein n=1 Tax=Araneus ventricosus TaxID=182803 RepID=A0A4Y2WKB3_ARAVE|nr:hypothetical protein AVEN_186650-1 [Araneus ventricosus]